jgi:Ca2+-binding EF-hand superfamily protein
MTEMYPDYKYNFHREFWVPARSYTEFSKQEIQIFIDAFREFDVDGSGTIDATELAAALKYMGCGDDAKVILKKFDADKSGVIEWPEYLEV